MAGATRFNYRLSLPWTKVSTARWALPAEWTQTLPHQPLSWKIGAGLFNIDTAYSILEAGEQPFGGVDSRAGWDHASQHARRTCRPRPSGTGPSTRRAWLTSRTSA
jgi:hypothetical protein